MIYILDFPRDNAKKQLELYRELLLGNYSSPNQLGKADSITVRRMVNRAQSYRA